MRYPRLSKALVTGTALTTLLPASAAYSSSLQPTDPHPHVPRAVSLVGADLHLRRGGVVTLPRAAGPRAVLLGTVRSGWVVAAAGTFRLVRPDGHVRTIARRDRVDLEVTETLSDDGRRIVSASIGMTNDMTIRVVDLQGRVALDGWFPYLPGDVMDAADGKVYVGGQAGLRVLEEESDTMTRVVRRPTGLVDHEHDTVFVASRKHPWQYGPTSLAHPGKPPWRARFTPVAASPDGRYVVGREGGVRAMTDGRVIRRVPVPEPGDTYRFLGWASNRRVLLETTSGRRHILVSCPVPSGVCGRVGSTTGSVSLPTSHAGPYRQP